MKDYISIFIHGYIFAVGSWMYYQDNMGLEEYIEHLELHWVEMSPLWGVGIMFLAAWWSYRLLQRKGLL